MQGAIRRFQPVIEERIANPQGFDFEAHFQHAWSGEAFANADWTKVRRGQGVLSGPGAHGGAARGQADRPAGGADRHLH